MSATRGRLAGLGATVVVLVLVAGTPLLLVAIGADPWSQDPGEIGTLLTSRDDGTLALLMIGVVAWLAWASMAVLFGIEILAALRGVPSPRLPGLGLPQAYAGRLVASAALLFAVVPTITPVFTPQPALTPPASEMPQLVSLSEAPAAATAEPIAQPIAGAPAVAPDQVRTTVDYTVRRGDSLWKIAEEQLGDGTRYVEIVVLNEAALHGRPGFIDPGLVLRLPSDADLAPEVDAQVDAEPRTQETHVVEPGDTLWDIAAQELGQGERYPEIFEASRDTLQPVGQHLTDPDLIRPGWKLTIPGDVEATPPDTTLPGGDDSPASADPPGTTAEPPGATTPGGEDVSQPPSETTPPTEDSASPPTAPERPSLQTSDAEKDEDFSFGWLMPGLMGAGAVLAGAVLVTVRAHRRTQQRHRRPGFRIAPPPSEVRAVEKTAAISGGPTADALGRLDRILRHLAAHLQPLPRLDAVELDTQTATLHLAEPADLPDPWSGSDNTWTTSLNATVGEEDTLPPYPLLASAGQGDDGHLWLLDLERLGVVSLTGDAERTRALARHLAAELALSPWAVITNVDTIDVAPELARLVPGRLTHHAPHDTAFMTRIQASLTQAQQNGLGDPEPYQALIIAGTWNQQLRAVVDLIEHQTARSGLAVVTVGSTEPGHAVIEVTPDGRLQVPHLDLDLRAAGLTADEAAATAAIVDLTRDATVAPMPHEEGATGWRALVDQAGALAEVLTEPRPTGKAGSGSLLPEATQRYEAVAATTAADIDELAPVVPEQSRRMVEAADPGLDEDLAEWRDPESRLPKLTLLGPVRVVAKVGVAVREVAERKAYFTEMVAYLALHPSGVSSRQVREAFGISASRARTDLGCIRTWFGTSSRTGIQHLPPANSSPAHTERGTNGYQLSDVLVDLDLLRRLRARAQARGAEGMADLVAALELVTGEPFSALRDPGWSWLLDEERIHETAVIAVVDVAHLVATDALSRGDKARARFAVETGCMAAPHDEVCRLDLAKVAEAEGHTALAEQILDEHVFNRTDDHLPPIDLPQRTTDVVKNHRWDGPKRPAQD